MHSFTIHAGEAAGPESMQEVDLGTKRIGHGIRCLESEQLVQELINQHITLECCATSNLNTKVFKNRLISDQNSAFKKIKQL